MIETPTVLNLCKVNEDIEANIQRTRKIESEILRCSEMDKSYFLRESKLLEMVSCEEFELNNVLAVASKDYFLVFK